MHGNYPVRLFLSVLAISMTALNPAIARQVTQPENQAVSDTLDALHRAASEADFERYFNLFIEDAIFLGTDATERWTTADFKSYARPHFEAGRGWTYHPVERHVYLSENGRTAWFDERLDNDSYGETRGSGVLSLTDGGWKIAQYNLSIPVPNELASELVRQIRALDDNNR